MNKERFRRKSLAFISGSAIPPLRESEEANRLWRAYKRMIDAKVNAANVIAEVFPPGTKVRVARNGPNGDLLGAVISYRVGRFKDAPLEMRVKNEKTGKIFHIEVNPYLRMEKRTPPGSSKAEQAKARARQKAGKKPLASLLKFPPSEAELRAGPEESWDGEDDLT